MKRENITVTTFTKKNRVKDKVKKHIVPMMSSIITAAFLYTIPVHASGVSEVLNPINNLKTLVLAIIGAVGVIILAKNVMEFAQAYQQIGLFHLVVAGALAHAQNAVRISHQSFLQIFCFFIFFQLPSKTARWTRGSPK